VLKAVSRWQSTAAAEAVSNDHRRHILLSNQTAVSAAARAASSHGFVVEVADDLTELSVETGCLEIEGRTQALLSNLGEDRIACLISGGEFSCRVVGTGIGGRNAEAALRMALLLDRKARENATDLPYSVFLSAGTDGIDGNSPAAGAIADTQSVSRAADIGLDAESYLNNSDAFTFFNSVGDAVITGPTWTNVRDLRVMIARK
jgi:glycerate 2-kinase